LASKRIVLRFPPRLINRPIVSDLVKRCDLEFNILKAYVTQREEGLLVLEISGTSDACERGLNYLAEMGVSVQPLSQDIVRDDDRCTHCGVCVSVCPSEALVLDRETMMVLFDNEKCIACELCIKACPTRAMELHF
jgi:ferredoxin